MGIVGYGAYVPRYRLPASEVARIWTDGEGGLPIKEKAVAGIDEDVVTMSIEAARNALARARIEPRAKSAPSGLAPNPTLTRSSPPPPSWQRPSEHAATCRPPIGSSPVKPAPKRWSPRSGLSVRGMADYAMAIGMDTAQGKPGDALEYTAGAGGAAFLLGAGRRMPWP